MSSIIRSWSVLRGQLLGIIVFCRHIWVRRLLSSERQSSLAAQMQEAQLFMEEVRGLWALGRDAEVGGGGSGAARDDG